MSVLQQTTRWPSTEAMDKNAQRPLPHAAMQGHVQQVPGATTMMTTTAVMSDNNDNNDNDNNDNENSENENDEENEDNETIKQ